MIRARFYANKDDYRPVVWPVPHPYWCSGSSDEYSIIVAYATDIEEIKRQWPEAVEIDAEEVDSYKFSSRFPKPEWFVYDEPKVEEKEEKIIIPEGPWFCSDCCQPFDNFPGTCWLKSEKCNELLSKGK